MNQPTLDHTHAPDTRSWVESANSDLSDFPLQNLPYGCFRTQSDSEWRIGVAIGDQILDLRKAATAGLELDSTLSQPALNGFMKRPASVHTKTRHALFDALAEEFPLASELKKCLVPQANAEMGLPCHIGGYTDFFTGIHHAREAGRLFRPEDPLTPNYHWVPIAYHGRASSIVPSGSAVRRPKGQVSTDGQTATYLPTLGLDYELEVGVLVSRDNELGDVVPVDQADDHWFGLVLLNDWSARDVQRWEAQPLGPFLAKNFSTTISPWVVTREALAPFRVPAMSRQQPAPEPLPHLYCKHDASFGGIDLTLEAWLQTPEMRKPCRLMQSSFRETSWWTVAQMIAHHTSNGCNLNAGDLLGTGTQSGPQPDQGGCLLELTLGGKKPVLLPNGDSRTYLQDGDHVVLRGYCAAQGRRRIGFGDCAGSVLPARA